jgi:hypothetical protein
VLDAKNSDCYEERFVHSAAKFTSGGRPNPILIPMISNALEWILQVAQSCKTLPPASLFTLPFPKKDVKYMELCLRPFTERICQCATNLGRIKSDCLLPPEKFACCLVTSKPSNFLGLVFPPSCVHFVGLSHPTDKLWASKVGTYLCALPSAFVHKYACVSSCEGV